MSGITGGDRISKKDFMNVVNSYIEILMIFERFVKYEISGSFHSKNNFGDIDLIIQFTDTQHNIDTKILKKKQLKDELIKFLLSLPKDIILPFKNKKHKNKTHYNSGEIITILFPQPNNKCVQIDNIIALSEKELIFKKHFLDLPAEKQGLILGLVKTILLENKTLANALTKIYPIEENQELEFNLSSSNLELRKVTLGDNYKQLNKTVVFKTNNWNFVKTYLRNYKFHESFENLAADCDCKLKEKRSRKRLKGLFNSMVSVKSGEAGTAKGDRKLIAIQKINELF